MIVLLITNKILMIKNPILSYNYYKDKLISIINENIIFGGCIQIQNMITIKMYFYLIKILLQP